MKKLLPVLLLALWLGSCQHEEKILVNPLSVDSLITHYAAPLMAAQNEVELQFWKSRINPARPGYLNESRYAACLNMAFRLSGEIDSLQKADSILLALDRNFNHREASADLALVAHCISEHRFREADSLLGKAKQLGLRPYESHTVSFDVAFELGNYFQAKTELNAIRSPDDFGYYFRQSRLDHLNGRLDSAIADMDRALSLAGTSDYLKGAAQSNAGDLYLHAEDPARARDAYFSCIRRNNADFHSWMGLGWIALVHDGDARMADTLFRFVQAKNPLPDPLFRLEQVAEAGGDSGLQVRYALEFTREATRPVYGGMYNKYLIQLFTGILHDPAAAEALAGAELKNRATPQTYAWYVWALFVRGKKDQAYALFQQRVSGKPLEALELFWMGRLMEGLGKNYNAREFFKAAARSRYDLDPADAIYVQKKLEE
ncbi:MAG TPA: hypothetical protein VNW04_15095 [Puia sp.]|nr:hypothetical protein [Puia sp.]